MRYQSCRWGFPVERTGLLSDGESITAPVEVWPPSTITGATRESVTKAGQPVRPPPPAHAGTHGHLQGGFLHGAL